MCTLLSLTAHVLLACSFSVCILPCLSPSFPSRPIHSLLTAAAIITPSCTNKQPTRYDTRRDLRLPADAPVIGLVLQRSHLVTGDEGHYSGVVAELEARGECVCWGLLGFGLGGGVKQAVVAADEHGWVAVGYGRELAADT